MPQALIPFIPAIIGGAGAVAGAVGNSRPRTSTSTSQQSGTSSSSTTAVLTGAQRKLMRQLAEILGGKLAQGPQVSEANRNLAYGQVNQRYGAMDANLERALTSRGYGSSGKLGTGLRSNAYQKAGAYSNEEARLRGEAENDFARTLALTSSFIQPHSSETTGTSSSTGSGTSTQPGQSLLAGLGGVGMDIGQLLLLKDLLGSSSGGGIGTTSPGGSSGGGSF